MTLKKDITSSADVQFQAQPIEHKPHKQSIFETVDKDVSVFIRAAGWSKEKGNFYLVFSSSPPHDVLFMVNYLNVRGKWMMKIVDRNGNEHAEATEEGTGNNLHWEITHNTIRIGRISLSKQATDQRILQSCNSTIHEKPSKQEKMAIFQYFDESETEVAGITHNGPLVKLEIKKKLMADEEKVLLCCSINRAQVVYKIRQRTPRILPISVITCNCSLCEEFRNTTGSAIFHSLSDPLFIRAAGYNRSKNLVYFDVFFAPSSSVVHTVECTPRDNQQGIVKLVIKDGRSNILWTAVQLPGDIFAFYFKENNLLGYQWKNVIFNVQNKEVMYIQKLNYQHKAGFQHVPSQKVKFSILDTDNLLVATISQEINCTSIYRPKVRTETANLSKLELVFLIPLAVKINSEVYKMDEWPLPEITYHYKNAREQGKFVF